jgi:hypothetical protein
VDQSETSCWSSAEHREEQPDSQFAKEQKRILQATSGYKERLLARHLLAFAATQRNRRAVDAADYIVWHNTLCQSGAGLAADGDGDDVVKDADCTVWRAHFGQTADSGTAMVASGGTIPEPATCKLLLVWGYDPRCPGTGSKETMNAPNYFQSL